jgi:hypothetical protein
MTIGTTEVAALGKEDGRNPPGIIDEGDLLQTADLHGQTVLSSKFMIGMKPGRLEMKP